MRQSCDKLSTLGRLLPISAFRIFFSSRRRLVTSSHLISASSNVLMATDTGWNSGTSTYATRIPMVRDSSRPVPMLRICSMIPSILSVFPLMWPLISVNFLDTSSYILSIFDAALLESYRSSSFDKISSGLPITDRTTFKSLSLSAATMMFLAWSFCSENVAADRWSRLELRALVIPFAPISARTRILHS